MRTLAAHRIISAQGYAFKIEDFNNNFVLLRKT